MRPFFSIAAAVVLTASAAFGEGESDLWIQDFAAAKARAAKESKDLLLDFTGSDWCSWCMKLDKEVFSTDEFKTAVVANFVLVKLDYPKDQTLVTEEVKKQNAGLQGDFNIEGYPSIFLTDASGRPYAKTGYEAGGPENYLKNLDKLRETKKTRDEALAKAEGLRGAERAKGLDEALTALGDVPLLPFYKAQVDEIVTLDADGKLELKSKYEELIKAHEEALKQQAMQRKLQVVSDTAQPFMMKQDWDGLNKALDELIEKNKGEMDIVQFATFFKAVPKLQQQNFAEALPLVEEAIKLAPDSDLAKEQLKPLVEQLKVFSKMKKPAKDDDDDDDGEKDDGGKDG